MGFNLEDYETVEERLAKFWKEYPDGRIETELIEAAKDRFIVMARVYRTEADARYWASGLAFENISEKGVNATNALENCETSAIGRALANCGYATRGKRPSREEMGKVERFKAERIIKVEKPSDPWTVETKSMPVNLEEALVQLNDGIKPEEIPSCKHGTMAKQDGVGKTNRPYFGYVCRAPRDQQCSPIWYVKDNTGRWIPPKPRVENKEL